VQKARSGVISHSMVAAVDLLSESRLNMLWYLVAVRCMAA